MDQPLKLPWCLLCFFLLSFAILEKMADSKKQVPAGACFTIKSKSIMIFLYNKSILTHFAKITRYYIFLYF